MDEQVRPAAEALGGVRRELYFVLYVEPLCDARTMLAGFFNNLLDLCTRLLTEPGFERFPEHAFMVRLISGDAGVIFQLQHLLNHAHSKRRTLRLMFLVPYGKTTLRLACPAFIEDMPITVS